MKELMREKEAVEEKIENLFITNIYYGALANSVYYPETMEELRCMFVGSANRIVKGCSLDKAV